MSENSIKVYIASRNPVKIACTESAFQTVFPDKHFIFNGISVNSGVSDQPMTDEETWRGAKTRAENIREKFKDGHFWVGIEGGIEVLHDTMHAFAWMVILNNSLEGEARTATFPLPPKIKSLVDEGMELGHADDLVFKRNNSKQKDGAVGILTGGIIDRASYYEHALILALIPFLKEELFKPGE